MTKNFKRNLLAGLFVPVLGFSVGTALAQSTAPAAPVAPAAMATSPGAMGTTSWNAQTFERMDKNKDGKISREEAQADAAMKDAWTKMDATNRGSISKEEFEKYRTTQPGATGAPGSSPPPNSSTALPSTTNPATTPSSGSGTTKSK